MDVTSIRRIRGGYKGSNTKLIKETFASIDTLPQSRIQGVINTIREGMQTIDSYSSKLYVMITDPDELNKEIEADTQYRMDVNSIIVDFESKLKSERENPSGNASAFKLPKLTLPTFGGNPLDWTSFWDVFKCSVHKNSNLTDVQKFTYLRGQLLDDAKKLIDGFKLEDKSYASSIQLLQKTYGQEDKIKAALINNLLEATPPSYNLEELKSFYASFENTLRAMNAMSITMEEMCTIVLMNKVPSPLKEVIRREMKDDSLKLEDFITRYQSEVFNMDDIACPPVVGSIATASFNVQEGNNVKKKKLNCKLCSSPKHVWFKCGKYPQSGQKVKRAQNLRLCKGCLSADHGENGCVNPNVKTCKYCDEKHYYSLCSKGRKNDQPVKGANKSQGDESQRTQALTVSVNKQTTILPTIRLPVRKQGGGSKMMRALLDQCSQRSFVLRSILPSLRYESKGTEELRLQGFTKVNEPSRYEVVTIYYRRRSRTYPLTAVVVESLPKHGPGNELKAKLLKMKKKRVRLADSQVTETDEIQLLIGADFYYDIVHPGYLREGELILLPTICGYAISGTYSAKGTNTTVEVVTILKVAVGSTDANPVGKNIPCKDDLECLWNLDSIGIVSKELDLASRKILQDHSRRIEYDEDERQYRVELPWKENKPLLPTNFGLALGRLRTMQKRFAGHPELQGAYEKIIADQESRGFIEEVTGEDRYKGDEVHYLSHHGVIKDSVTTPLRVVFDCSAKTAGNLSLNDCLETGPSLVPDLVKVLLRFRYQRFAWISDIEKAFLMVQLHEKDRDFTRFLWPEVIKDMDSPYKIYRFKVVLFGATCSQFLLNATILHHMSNIQLDTSQKEDILNGLYIDNLQATSNCETELVEKHVIAQQVFDEAHLPLKEWSTNSHLLRRTLEEKGISASQQEVVKTLGLRWLTSTDCLTFSDKPQMNTVTTKRLCLSITSQLFDPLGMLLPVSIRARLALQNLWRLKVDWDEVIPLEYQEVWQSIVRDLVACEEINFPRRVTDCQDVVLHAFSDASTVAYGTSLYIVSKGESKLLIAKAKVAPIKPVTVPKLELTAVLLSARLVNFVCEAYQGVLNITDIYLWSDSQVALHWLQNKKAKPLYVVHRVDEIQSLIPCAKIRYVPTSDNPSDILTRGISTKQLMGSSLWWQGPQWLNTPENWPEEKQFGEMTVESTIANLVQADRKEELHVEWHRYGSYDKAIRIMAWLIRYVTNLRRKTKGSAVLLDPTLTMTEVKAAEIKVIRLVQVEEFSRELNIIEGGNDSKKATNLMRQLGLYLENGLLKCRGRMQMAELRDSTKYPILLPNAHVITDLLISKYHILSKHFGANYVVAALRQRYWIPRMRQAVKRIHKRCVICKKLQGKHYPAVDTPPLPEFRVERTDPFQITGVDYTGVMYVRNGNNTIGKLYVILFTCAVTRAIHLEMVDNMSCDSFIHAFRRFASKQGFPKLMLSDNATTFVGAANYLRSIINDPKVTYKLQDCGCEWRFIPARAPWFGAIWERVIGIVKACVKKVLGRAMVSREELITVLSEVEATVNDRPLTYASGDLDDLEPLTPSMLNRGRRLREFPKELVGEDERKDPTYRSEQTMRLRLAYVNKLLQDLWKRWSHEYLTALRDTHKNMHKNKAQSWPQLGDIVLIQDEGSRMMWKMGKITRLYPGPDGIIRVVQLKTSTGETTRPVVKLYPIEQSLEVVPGNVIASPTPAGPDRSCVGGTPRTTRRAALASVQHWRARIRDGDL